MKTVVEMENSGVIHMLKHNKIEGLFTEHIHVYTLVIVTCILYLLYCFTILKQ